MDRILGHSGPDDKVGGQTFSIVQLKYFAGNILKRFLKNASGQKDVKYELLWHFFTQGEEAIFKYRKYTAVARTANQAESMPPNHGHVMTGGNVQNT